VLFHPLSCASRAPIDDSDIAACPLFQLFCDGVDQHVCEPFADRRSFIAFSVKPRLFLLALVPGFFAFPTRQHDRGIVLKLAVLVPEYGLNQPAASLRRRIPRRRFPSEEVAQPLFAEKAPS
jgi:hypothetical protein